MSTPSARRFAFHPGGAQVAFADGSVRFLNATITLANFSKLVTREAREIVSGNDF